MTPLPRSKRMMDTQDEIERLLDAGINALKANERDLAREWLLRVIDLDRENVQAWLWLSGALDDPEERRLCLKNVLTLDPENRAARRGLQRLDANAADRGASFPVDEAEAAPDDMEQVHMRREMPAPSPASAVLYPERQVREWHYQQKQLDVRPLELGTTSASSFNDVWSGEAPLCAYCAAPVQADDRRCPQCRRKLTFRLFRYAKPSANMVVLAVMVFSLAQLFLIQGIYGLLRDRSLVQVIVPGIIAAWLVVLAGAVFVRQPWSHAAALATLGVLLAYFLLQPIVPVQLALQRIPGLDPAIAKIVEPIPGALARALRWFQLAAAGIGLFYAVWFAAPDFEREERRHLAVLRSGLTAADQYDATAQRLARSGMWAAAVVHWQRAVAMEPLRVQYQRSLAQAYARLGFMTRSLDMVASAVRLAGSPVVKRELEALQADLEAKAGTQSS